MAAFPAQVTTATVTAVLTSAVVDGADVDLLPDAVPLTGQVTFTPDKVNGQLLVPTATPPLMVTVKAMPFTLAADGSLSANLVVIPGATYTVSFALAGVRIAPFSIGPLVAGTTYDLASLAPVTALSGIQMTKGDKGDPGTASPSTDASVAAAITTPGTATKTALSAAFADKAAQAKQARPGNWTVFLGDSITSRGSNTPDIGWRGEGFPQYASIFSGQRIRYARNAGKSGDTSALMLARFDTDVTPYAPGTVVVLAGTNDTGTSVPIATFQANIRAIVAKIRAIGAVPVLCTIPPNGSAAPVDRKARISAANAWLCRYAATSGITMVDFYTLLVDPATGGYLSPYGQGDFTHPTNPGDYIMGKLLSDTLCPQLPAYVPDLPSDAIDPNNFVLNPLFLAGSNPPTSWTNQGGVTGQTLSVVTGDTSIKGNWFRYDAAASNGTSTLFQTRTTNPAGASVVPGNTYAFMGRVKASALTTSTISAFLRFQGGVTTDFKALYSFTQPLIPGGVFYVEAVAPASSVSVMPQLQIAAGTGDVEFAQIGVYDLTALGALG